MDRRYFLVLVTLLAIAASIGYFWGSSNARKESALIQGKTNKVFNYIKQEFPNQWDSITYSRPYIEYDITIKERTYRKNK